MQRIVIAIAGGAQFAVECRASERVTVTRYTRQVSAMTKSGEAILDPIIPTLGSAPAPAPCPTTSVENNKETIRSPSPPGKRAKVAANPDECEEDCLSRVDTTPFKYPGIEYTKEGKMKYTNYGEYKQYLIDSRMPVSGMSYGNTEEGILKIIKWKAAIEAPEEYPVHFRCRPGMCRVERDAKEKEKLTSRCSSPSSVSANAADSNAVQMVEKNHLNVNSSSSSSSSSPKDWVDAMEEKLQQAPAFQLSQAWRRKKTAEEKKKYESRIEPVTQSSRPKVLFAEGESEIAIEVVSDDEVKEVEGSQILVMDSQLDPTPASQDIILSQPRSPIEPKTPPSPVTILTRVNEECENNSYSQTQKLTIEESQALERKMDNDEECDALKKRLDEETEELRELAAAEKEADRKALKERVSRLRNGKQYLLTEQQRENIAKAEEKEARWRQHVKDEDEHEKRIARMRGNDEKGLELANNFYKTHNPPPNDE